MPPSPSHKFRAASDRPHRSHEATSPYPALQGPPKQSSAKANAVSAAQLSQCFLPPPFPQRSTPSTEGVAAAGLSPQQQRQCGSAADAATRHRRPTSVPLFFNGSEEDGNHNCATDVSGKGAAHRPHSATDVQMPPSKQQPAPINNGKGFTACMQRDGGRLADALASPAARQATSTAEGSTRVSLSLPLPPTTWTCLSMPTGATPPTRTVAAIAETADTLTDASAGERLGNLKGGPHAGAQSPRTGATARAVLRPPPPFVGAVRHHPGSPMASPVLRGLPNTGAVGESMLRSRETMPSFVMGRSSATMTEPPSSCLPTDAMEPESMLHSPLAQPLLPLTAKPDVASRYDEGTSPVFHSSSHCCYSLLSSTQEALLPAESQQMTHNVTHPWEQAGVGVGSFGSGSWEAKRVRHVSATQCSRDSSSAASPYASAASLCTTLRSPVLERAFEAAGAAAAWDSAAPQKRGCLHASRELHTPYWTPFPQPPQGGGSTTTSSPCFPGINIAVFSPADAAAIRHGPLCAAAISGPPLVDPVGNEVNSGSPVPQYPVGERLRWSVPLSMSNDEAQNSVNGSSCESPRVARRTPQRAHHTRERRYSMPHQDSSDHFESLPQ